MEEDDEERHTDVQNVDDQALVLIEAKFRTLGILTGHDFSNLAGPEFRDARLAGITQFFHMSHCKEPYSFRLTKYEDVYPGMLTTCFFICVEIHTYSHQFL